MVPGAGAEPPPPWAGEGRERLLTDGQHEEGEDAHHVPQAHVPEHHGLLGQRRRLGLGRGRAGLRVGERGVSQAGRGGDRAERPGLSKDSAQALQERLEPSPSPKPAIPNLGRIVARILITKIRGTLKNTILLI